MCYRSLSYPQYENGTMLSATLVPEAVLKAVTAARSLTLWGQAKMQESQGYSVASKAIRICIFNYTSTLATETVEFGQR